MCIFLHVYQVSKQKKDTASSAVSLLSSRVLSVYQCFTQCFNAVFLGPRSSHRRVGLPVFLPENATGFVTPARRASPGSTDGCTSPYRVADHHGLLRQSLIKGGCHTAGQGNCRVLPIARLQLREGGEGFLVHAQMQIDRAIVAEQVADAVINPEEHLLRGRPFKERRMGLPEGTQRLAFAIIMGVIRRQSRMLTAC